MGVGGVSVCVGGGVYQYLWGGGVSVCGKWKLGGKKLWKVAIENINEKWKLGVKVNKDI